MTPDGADPAPPAKLDRLNAAIDGASATVEAAAVSVERISVAHFEADRVLARATELLRELTAIRGAMLGDAGDGVGEDGG